MDLRDRAVREMRQFETSARDNGVPMEQLRPSHYALCASIDDVVLNTPWGSNSAWDTRSLVSTFHQEVRSGERFFDLLGAASADPRHCCSCRCSNFDVSVPVARLSWGATGCRRAAPASWRSCARRSLRHHRPPATGRRNSRPVAALAGLPRRPIAAEPRPTVPVLGRRGARDWRSSPGLFLWFSTDSLNAASDDLFERMMKAAAGLACRQSPGSPRSLRRTPPPAPPEARPVDKLRTFLKPEIDAGLVVVLGTDNTPVIRIRNRGLFPSGSATLQPQYLPLMDRIGASALKTEPGIGGAGGRLHRQPADPHRAVSLQLPALHRPRRRRPRDHRPQHRRPEPDQGRGARRFRPDRAQHDAGRPRREPAHRDHSEATGLARGFDDGISPVSHVALVPELRCGCDRRSPGLGVWAVPRLPRRLGRPRDRHRGPAAAVVRHQFLDARTTAAPRPTPHSPPVPPPPPPPRPPRPPPRRSPRCATSSPRRSAC